MQIFIAYVNVNDRKSWQALPQKALPTCVCLPNSPNQYQQKRYLARTLAYRLLWQLGKDDRDFRTHFSQIFLDKWRRPQIPSSKWDFNISHSGDWVAVVLGKRQKGEKPCLGLDIESPHKTRPYLRLMRNIANPEEFLWFKNDPCPQKFYQAWCLREAVLKASGVGLRKLSNVQIDHPERTILCPYIPQGNAYFYAHLPFYLALYHQYCPFVSFQIFHPNQENNALSQSLFYIVNASN